MPSSVPVNAMAIVDTALELSVKRNEYVSERDGFLLLSRIYDSKTSHQTNTAVSQLASWDGVLGSRLAVVGFHPWIAAQPYALVMSAYASMFLS
jgi:hypothetical protein